jgi:hypothetical protein
MGMFDEIYCEAALPDGDDPPGTRFQTKSFPSPCMFRYRITAEGRLVDSDGNDVEPDGYINFYTAERAERNGLERPGIPGGHPTCLTRGRVEMPHLTR